jgi:hypothetical protein
MSLMQQVGFFRLLRSRGWPRVEPDALEAIGGLSVALSEAAHIAFVSLLACTLSFRNPRGGLDSIQPAMRRRPGRGCALASLFGFVPAVDWSVSTGACALGLSGAAVGATTGSCTWARPGHVQPHSVSTACARVCASRLESGRPFSPLAISRSTKQKRFQSLKQASLTGLSAMSRRRSYGEALSETVIAHPFVYASAPKISGSKGRG